MIKYNIYFQDLKEEVQQEVWALLSKCILEEGWVERDSSESEDDFLGRLHEETDHYINTHNFPVKLQL